MQSRKIDYYLLMPRQTTSFLVRSLRLKGFAVLTAISLVGAQSACSQEATVLPSEKTAAPVNAAAELKLPVDFEDSPASAVPAEELSGELAGAPIEATSASETQNPGRQPVESEILYEGLVSYGNYKIFASGYDMKLFTAGVEYDRHSWGYLLGAQMDYVAEFLPFILLDKPLATSIYGTPSYKSNKNIRQYVPGVGFSPIGFRMQWRSKKAIKPYLEAKGGMIGFTKKVPSSEASYENFSLQTGTGLQLRMSERWGLRLGLFSDFHFSNAFVVPVNPGLDVMNANLAISYHLGHRVE
ncbi:MAG: acyloxyacyl hydrolase [Terracidiphilus sp.]